MGERRADASASARERTLAYRIKALATNEEFIEDVTATFVAGNNHVEKVRAKIPALVDAIAAHLTKGNDDA